MQTLSLVLLVIGVLLIADAAAFEGRYTQSALATLDHGSKEVRHGVDDWLNSRRYSSLR